MLLSESPRHAMDIRDAEKSADSLFESQSIAQIREVEAKARTDIEGKKQHLRQLVGSSYRDLIESADTIILMRKCCESAVLHVKGIQDDFVSLTASAHTAIQQKGHKKRTSSQHEQLFAVGSRVKYLVDTSELLWGCLDTQDYLEAANRFLRASEVYHLLQDTATASMARFPLLRNQWPSILAFRTQISEAVQRKLRSAADLSVTDTAAALAAVSFLQQLTSSQALDLMLDCCRGRIMQPLEAAINEDTSEAQLAALLMQLLEGVQTVVLQVGQLFLTGSASTEQPLLLRFASEDLSSSELLFSPLPGQDHSQESEAWQAVRKASLERLAPFTPQSAAAACRSWLGQIASDMQRHCPALMAACASSASFAALETQLQSAIQQWQPLTATLTDPTPSTTPKLSSATPRSAPWTPRPSPLSPQARTPFTDTDSNSMPHTWEGVCEWVLGGALDLWQQLFEGPFVQHARQLIKEAFTGTSQSLQEPLANCMKLAQQAPPAPPGGFYAAQWPEDPLLDAATGTLFRTASRHTGFNSRSYKSRKRARPGQDVGDGTAGWRGQLGAVCKDVDNQLGQALHGSMLLLGQQTQKDSSPASNRGSSSHTGKQAESPARAKQLQPFIQDQCDEAVRSMAAMLREHLQRIGEPSMDLDGAKLVEQALLIGKLSNVLCNQTPALKMIMGSPQAWQATSFGAEHLSALSSASIPEGRPSAKGTDVQRYKQLQEVLRPVTLEANQVWARWSGQGLCMELQAALESDAAFSSPIALQAWEETVIAQEEGEEEGVGEMRFKLPASASPGAMLFLLAGCREVARAGGHSAGSAAIRLLQWQLSHAVLQAFSVVFELGGALHGKASEKGLLQLLFDVRFLWDALSGGRPLGDPQPDPVPSAQTPARSRSKNFSPAMLERQQGFDSLESMLSSQLDPIDWATYEPYLWSNEATFYQRAGTLFGILLQTQRLHTQVTPKPATSFTANILSTVQTAPRFSYLPVSNPALNPSALRKGAVNTSQAAGMTSGLVAGRLAASSPAGGPFEVLDQTGNYSFANISVGRVVATGSAEQKSAQSSDSTPFQALQSKFTASTTGTSQRLGAFGSLLGDKAAEVTAMASQSLGDYVPSAFPSGLASSGLSNLTHGASGLLAGFKGLRSS